MTPFHIALYTGIGITIEGYDFAIYGLLSKEIGHNFFSQCSPSMQLFMTLGILVLGNLVRPVSGLITGFWGDRLGRRHMLTHTLVGMTIFTFMIGILPGFSYLGWMAGILLASCRIIQNLMMGGDFPGAVTYLLEHATKAKRGLYFGIMFGVLGFGASIASGTIALLTRILTPEQFCAFGYRIPFILGGLFGLIGIIMRRRLPESPEFLDYIKQADLKRTPPPNLATVFKRIWRPSLLVIGMSVAALVISLIKTVLPISLNQFYHYQATDIYLALSLAYFLSGFAKLFFGWVSDSVGHKTIAFASSGLLFIGTIPMFILLSTSGQRWALYSFILYLQLVTSLSAASVSILVAAAFPAEVRYAGTGFSNNMANLIASFSPLLVQYSYSELNSDAWIMAAFVSLALLSIICIHKLSAQH